MSQKKVCVGSIEDVRHDHTCFVSSCRLKNKVNDLIDTANDWSKRLKRSHHKTFMLKGRGVNPGGDGGDTSPPIFRVGGTNI